MKSANEILEFLSRNGMIDLEDVEATMKRKEIENLVEAQHPFVIFRASDGRWKTHIAINGQRKLIAKTRKDDLYDYLHDIYATHTSRNETLESLYPKWLEYKSLRVESTTIDRVKRDWNRYYKNEDIIKKPISELSKLDLDMWIHKQIRSFSMDKHQYSNFRLILRQELEYAVDLGIIQRNPFRDVKIDSGRVLRKTHKRADSTQVYSRLEFEQLYELALNDFQQKKHPVHQLVPLAVIFMFFTGLRVGEVCALRYEDVLGDRIIVRHMLRYPDGVIVDSTKGSFGDRFVPLIFEAEQVISMARDRQLELGASVDGYVFSTTNEPVLYTSVTKAFYTYCKQMGIEPKSSHKARKTFVSSLLDANVNLNTVRQIVGHVDERTTLNNYCYDRSSDDEKLEKISNALTGRNQV